MDTALVPVFIFLAALLLIVFDVLEKSLVALSGAIALLVFGYLKPEEAISSISFETIILLISMMILVDISRKSGLFSWLSVRLVSLTRGNPIFIFILFSLLTLFLSAFLNNVTTILVVVPITIELFRGLGRDPRYLILMEVFMTNLGGALTLIGDPTNIIIGGSAGLSFNEFIINLWLPISIIALISLLFIIVFKWNELKPISSNLKELFLSMILIRKLEYKFSRMHFSRLFILKSVFVLLLTLIAFIFQDQIGLRVDIIAIMGATILALITVKEAHVHESLQAVEWTTLLFFSGLFIMVAGVENTGVLKVISEFIISSTDNFALILLIILWATGIISMVLENIPFVTIMIPVIFDIQSQSIGGDHEQLLWWALSLGACLGGAGTMIGTSANVVAVGLAKKENMNITFLSYLKFGFPMAIMALSVSSAYLVFRFYFT